MPSKTKARLLCDCHKYMQIHILFLANFSVGFTSTSTYCILLYVVLCGSYLWFISYFYFVPRLFYPWTWILLTLLFYTSAAAPGSVAVKYLTCRSILSKHLLRRFRRITPRLKWLRTAHSIHNSTVYPRRHTQYSKCRSESITSWRFLPPHTPDSTRSREKDQQPYHYDTQAIQHYWRSITSRNEMRKKFPLTTRTCWMNWRFLKQYRYGILWSISIHDNLPLFLSSTDTQALLTRREMAINWNFGFFATVHHNYYSVPRWR